MANTDKPRGLTPVRLLSGAPYNHQVERYAVDSAYATALFIGDPVIHAGSSDSAGVPQVEAGGTSGQYIGVITGIDPIRTDLEKKHIPASTGGYVYVATDPNIVYEIQEDSDTATLAAADVGLNADLVAGAGDATTGRSGYELDSDSANTTNTLSVRILGLVQREDNEIGANAKWEVIINDHGLTVTTGVS